MVRLGHVQLDFSVISLGSSQAATNAACCSIDDYGVISKRIKSTKKYASVRCSSFAFVYLYFLSHLFTVLTVMVYF